MNKTQLVSKFAEKVGINKKNAALMVDTVIECMKEGILEEGELRITDFGSFKIKELPSREGRNPATGEIIPVPPTKILRFKVSNKFKQAVRQS